jgi:pyruvate,water dikinase
VTTAADLPVAPDADGSPWPGSDAGEALVAAAKRIDPGDVAWLHTLGAGDVAQFGGKNAALGELIGQLAAAGVDVPAGFATSARAYRAFLAQDGLAAWIHARLGRLDRDDPTALAGAGEEIRARIRALPLPATLESALRTMYAELCRREGIADLPVAVRSSATAEDLPDASFAGQQETYLNVCGIDALLGRVRDVFASLYTDRAIVYRSHHGFLEADVALSAGIQRMVRADLGASGVMFTLDPDSGFREVVVINAAYGLGENVVQGTVDPDEFHVHKPGVRAGRPAILRRRLGSKLLRLVFAGTGLSNEGVPGDLRQRFCLADDEVHALARHALAIEAHFGRPMDIEWARDGVTGKLVILQARPETVRAREGGSQLETFRLTGTGSVLCTGHAVGRRIGAGPARRVDDSADLASVQPGDVLVARATNPDWEPVMERVAAIVTDHGGRTCHAAIVARELGIPAVVGCGDATGRIAPGAEVTVSCAHGEEGRVYAGRIPFEHATTDLGGLPPLPVKLMLNVGNPDQAYDLARLPHAGVGLARMEFMIAQRIGVHPRAALEFATLPPDEQAAIAALAAGYADPVEFYVARLTEGIATLAAAFAPHPVIVRLSDFKSNEYGNLAGGSRYEPSEENPMIGFRGAARYIDPAFAACFALECRALRRVREDMGLDNVQVMVPFVRTVAEARAVVDALAAQGLRRGDHGLKLVMMCEIPSNALSADAFLDLFDGFSIGSNDLTQLTLGIDRDSENVTGGFDERDPAVKALMHLAIAACRRRGKTIGICGQGPSDHPDLAAWLLAEGIGSISLNPDSLLSTWLALAALPPTSPGVVAS